MRCSQVQCDWRLNIYQGNEAGLNQDFELTTQPASHPARPSKNRRCLPWLRLFPVAFLQRILCNRQFFGWEMLFGLPTSSIEIALAENQPFPSTSNEPLPAPERGPCQGPRLSNTGFLEIVCTTSATAAVEELNTENLFLNTDKHRKTKMQS